MTEPKFMTPAHRRAYLTHLNRCKAMDSYHRALIPTMTLVRMLSRVSLTTIKHLPHINSKVTGKMSEPSTLSGKQIWTSLIPEMS